LLLGQLTDREGVLGPVRQQLARNLDLAFGDIERKPGDSLLSTANDADRLRDYLARFGLDWAIISQA